MKSGKKEFFTQMSLLQKSEFVSNIIFVHLGIPV
jgi:hypothetical protein